MRTLGRWTLAAFLVFLSYTIFYNSLFDEPHSTWVRVVGVLASAGVLSIALTLLRVWRLWAATRRLLVLATTSPPAPTQLPAPSRSLLARSADLVLLRLVPAGLLLVVAAAAENAGVGGSPYDTRELYEVYINGQLSDIQTGTQLSASRNAMLSLVAAILCGAAVALLFRGMVGVTVAVGVAVGTVLSFVYFAIAVNDAAWTEHVTEHPYENVVVSLGVMTVASVALGVFFAVDAVRERSTHT